MEHLGVQIVATMVMVAVYHLWLEKALMRFMRRSADKNTKSIFIVPDKEIGM